MGPNYEGLRFLFAFQCTGIPEAPPGPGLRVERLRNVLHIGVSGVHCSLAFAEHHRGVLARSSNPDCDLLMPRLNTLQGQPNDGLALHVGAESPLHQRIFTTTEHAVLADLAGPRPTDS